MAVVLLDVRDFGGLNALLGRHVGDAVLAALAEPSAGVPGRAWPEVHAVGLSQRPGRGRLSLCRTTRTLGFEG